MSNYLKLKHKALHILEETKEGEYITEPEQLAAHFSDELSFVDFIQFIYNKKIAEILNRHKAEMKANLRTRWFQSRNFKANETLYKLLANQEELQRLKGESEQSSSSGSDPLLDVLDPQSIWNKDESDKVQ